MNCLREQLVGCRGHDLWGVLSVADHARQSDELLVRRGMLWICTFKSPETFSLGGCALHGGALRHQQISAFVRYIVAVELGCADMLLLSIDNVESLRRNLNLSL